MLYRALSDFDMKNLDKSNEIVAKEPINKKVKDSLIQIIPHISYGSNKSSCWISLSSSFDIVVEKYSMPYSDNNKRSNIAVVINNDKNSMKIKNSDFDLFNQNEDLIKKNHNIIMEQSLDKVEKITYDLSTKYNRKKLQLLKLLLKKDGSISDRFCLGYNYSTGAKEFLICNKINENDIFIILDPLRIDILYAIMKNKSLSETEILNILKSFLIYDESQKIELLPIEMKITIEHYVNNKSLTSIVEEIKQQNPKSDVLSIYNYVKEIKKIVLKRFINLYYNDLEEIYIPEDKIDINPIDENDYNNNFLRYDDILFTIENLKNDVYKKYQKKFII